MLVQFCDQCACVFTLQTQVQMKSAILGGVENRWWTSSLRMLARRFRLQCRNALRSTLWTSLIQKLAVDVVAPKEKRAPLPNDSHHT